MKDRQTQQKRFSKPVGGGVDIAKAASITGLMGDD